MATKGKDTLLALFDSQASAAGDIAKTREEQAVHYLRTGNEKAFDLSILPIRRMAEDPLYVGRFKNRTYDPVLLKSELVVLYAKDGANFWLVGERLAYIRDHKVYRQYGHDSFETFVREETPYSRSTAYNYIKAFENYTFEESLRAGSKLSLLVQTLELKNEKEQAKIFSLVTDKKVSYREAKSIIKEAVYEPENLMTKEEIRADVFHEVRNIASEADIPTRKTAEDTFEKITLDMDIPSIVRLKPGSMTLETPSDKQFIKDKDFRLMVAFESEAIMRLFNDALQNTFRAIKRNMEIQLSHEENSTLVRKLEKGGWLKKSDTD